MKNKDKDVKENLRKIQLEYKKKYNSKKQTLEEENKSISSINNLNKTEYEYAETKTDKELNNSSLNNNNYKNIINNNTISSNNNIKSNTQNTITNNSISEHIICEEERNQRISSRKAIPMHQINYPTEKKNISDVEKMSINNTYNKNNESTGINMNSKIFTGSNDNNITFKAKPIAKISNSEDDFLFDSKIKNRQLNEYSMLLDEKINDLKKKLNLNYNSTEIEKLNTFDNRHYNNFLSGVNNINLNSINTESKGNINNILNNNINTDNSNVFYKNNMNMDSFDFNSINMDQPSFGHQIFINNNNLNNNTLSIKDQMIFPEKSVKLSFDKLMSINQVTLKLNPFIILISYLNTKDIFQIFQTNKKMRELFIQALKLELNMYITSKFKHITKNLFDNYTFYIGLNKSLKSKELKIFLILKAKIISKNLLKKSVHLQYFAHFPCDNKQFVQNSFVFDVKSPPLYLWAMKESTNFNEDELNKAYFMNVMQYAINDYAEFTVNIFTDKGLMDIRKLVWDKITVFKTPDEDFLNYSNENILKREIVDFDVSRYSEMELCKGKWNDIILLENSESIIGELKNKFQKNFNILKILFDNVGYYIFKFYLEGSKPGFIYKDDEIGLDITVLPQPIDKSNETKKNNLVFDRKNEIQLHLGDVLIFYISKNV